MSPLEKIQQMIVDQFDLKKEDLTPDATLESLGLDSLSVIEFMFTIEDEFKIVLENEVVGDIKTLQDVVDIVTKLVAEQHAKAD